MTVDFTIAVAGGGAAGFFAAITCAESIPDCKVVLLEKSPEPLAKVMISGGGRCNVTHACFDPGKLVTHYPRGNRELIGPFHRFQPRDTVRWFEERGVKLKVEPDGRMFPTTDQSTTVTQCLIREAREAGVTMMTNRGLVSVAPQSRGFLLGLSDGSHLACDRLLIATGGNQNSPVFRVVEELGHTIKPLLPSLFSFDCNDARLKDLAGISVPDVEVSAPGTRLSQRGPLLVTHWGLSGPAILKLSAWGAPQFADLDYRFILRVCWTPDLDESSLREQIARARVDFARKSVFTSNFWSIPQRLWQSIIGHLDIRRDAIWNQFPRGAVEPLIETLMQTEFTITGKSMNKDEFVTCGGVSLDEVDFKTMQSKKCRGLYFAGEILDIDGVTGGFNFQSAWTTGWIAGKSIGQEI
ncbi:MAG TPA: NAD(P)/FAD-dependent oxidoreductase [Kiritimatiellia bacterium]|nr:NAD(P)/FAD-dependent oxidoreductase [Kiritimatiellia bacterium]HMO99310.1 NAD(P)/FAD-dependent oxidoreductase [Kiritimatiellia bacterium]HMP95642.1 NAD(P)/FAD-dependent oxidoreductase [Kiritimatiellia bacterium]